MTGISTTIKSFFSRTFYYTLAHHKEGIGGGLICLAVLLTMLFAAPWKFYTEINTAISQIPDFVNTLPEVKYKDHKISIDKPSPYIINLGKNPDGTKSLIIIDTRYKINDVDALTTYMKKNHIVLLVTETKLVTLKDKVPEMQELRITDLSSVQGDITMPHEGWKKLGEVCVKWGTPVICITLFIMMFIGIFLGYLVLNFFTAIPIKILTAIMKGDVEFSGAMRLAAGMRIPLTVIAQAPALVGIPSLPNSLQWAVWGVYVVFASFSACRKNM